MDYTIYYLVTCLLTTVLCVQEFTVTPQNMSVVQGTSIVLNCKVANRVGFIQWVFNGDLLGRDPNLPGLPRHSVTAIGDSYNLNIVDTQLEDDGYYECQVSATQTDPTITAGAFLTVLVPPDMPVIEGYSNGSRVEVNESTPLLQLTCHANGARPAATIEWYKNGNRVTENVVMTTEPVPGSKKENTKSVLSIRGDLRNEQQGANYVCRAKHKAVTMVLETMVTLNVLYPPNIPVITGYQSGQPVQANNTVRMICESSGGNPAPQVVWFKNDQKLDYSFSIGHGKSTNELSFSAMPLDNNAIYRCEASNQATQLPLTTQVKLAVHFPPTSVEISGEKLGKAGDQITLKCTSTHANPPAHLIWLSKGLTVAGANEEVSTSELGGFITVSTLTVTLTNQESTVLFMCQSSNHSKVVSTIELSVLYPPGKPTIEGYNPNDYAAAGAAKTLKCVASGGNPMATLKWFKGDEELTSEPQVNVGNIVTSELIFVPKPTDNRKEIKCAASNEASVVANETKITLTVYFPPASVNITFSPPAPTVGSTIRLTCISGPSNPPASIMWVKGGTRMRGNNLGNTASSNGGFTTTNVLEIISPTADDHGAAFFCEARNLVLDKGYSDAVTLDVKFKPVFNPYASHQIEIKVGQSGSMNLTARGNPLDITYTLYKNGVISTSSALDASNGILELSSIGKDDSGSYSLKAENAQGATFHNFTINVTFPASITSITPEVSQGIGGIAYFECEAEANPKVPNMITWSREGFDMTKTKQTYDSNGKGYLTVTELSKEDSGMFTCTAFNSIGDPATKEAKLIVIFDPKIKKTPQYAKAAGDQGDTVELKCLAEGSPEVNFKWKKGNTDITNGGQYEVYSKFVESNWYQGELKIMNVQKENYGQYSCLVANKNGTVTDSFDIKVDGTSIPDAPYDLKRVNSTHDSVTISWQPGFNGGLPQKFTIIVQKVRASSKTTYEIPDHYGTIYTVRGLERATQYEIRVKSENEHGPAASSPAPIVVKTLLSDVGGDNQLSQSQDDDMPVIIILVVCIVGIFLLALNVGLILFFVRKRKKRLESNSDTTSHTNTIELYGPNKEAALYPMTPSDDSRSYGTYEKNMDGFSDDYSNYEHNDQKSTSTNSSHTCNCYQIKVGVRSSVRGIKGNCCLPPDSSGDEDVKRVFLPPPGYQSYAPSSKTDSPVMNHKTFGGTYLDDPDKEQWQYEDPYRNRGKGTFDDYHENGYDDTCTRPKSITDFSDRSSRTASTSRLCGKTPPPQPPTRSSSKGATNHYCQSPVPPLPARNYDLSDLPPPVEEERYVPPPGESYNPNMVYNPSYNGPTVRSPSRNYREDDMRGHLV